MKAIYKIMFFFSLALTIAAVSAVVVFGLNLGVDFKGGSVMELNFRNERPDIEDLRKAISDWTAFKDAVFSPAGENGLLIKGGEISEQTHQEVIQKIAAAFPSAGLEEQKFDSVGPVIGSELKRKSVSAIFLVLAAIIVYIAIVFRKLSRTISGWAMGLAAVVALLHDMLIPVGVFAFLGQYYGVEISAVFVAAVLTILGYSVSDTVVVFDRVRENIIKQGVGERGEGFGAVVHKSILQTLTRSLNTTFTTLLSLVAIYLFGGESIRFFALALIMGIFLGAYSSIFVASPLLIWWNRRTGRQ